MAGLRRHIRPILSSRRFTLAFSLVAGLALGLVTWSFLGAMRVTIDPLRVEVRPVPSITGKTVLELPPLGSVEARTHASPLKLSVRPTGLGFADLERYVAARPSADEVRAQIGEAVRKSAPGFALRALLAGALGGLLAAGLLRRGALAGILSTTAGAVAPIILLAMTTLTYNTAAFREPVITGPLSAAPQFVGSLEQVGRQFDEFRRQLEAMGATAFRLYRFLDEQSDIPADAVRILHISDIHLNPIGFDLAVSIADAFRVHAVLDSGDTTMEGTRLEAEFLQNIERFRRPYIWVRGNHDTLATQEAVDAFPGAIALDFGTAEVAGLTVYGVGDPITPDMTRNLSIEEQNEIRRVFSESVEEAVGALVEPPDILLVHDRQVAQPLAGQVPLVLSGHTHCFRWIRQSGSLLLTVGSSAGGSGLRGVAPGADGLPYEFQVLYVERDPVRLVAIDRIEAREGGSRLFLTRRMFEPVPDDEGDSEDPRLIFTSCPRLQPGETRRALAGPPPPGRPAGLPSPG